MEKLKSTCNKAILYPTKAILYLIQLFAKPLFEEVEDHAFMGSKLSKQDVQLTRTLILKLLWMYVKIKIKTKHKLLNYLNLTFECIYIYEKK